MFDSAKTTQNPAELIVGEKQSVSTGKENVSDLRVGFQIPVSLLKIGMQLLFAHAADDAASGTIAAIGSAPVCD